MIDAKNFMEFFEKQFGVKFIDANTGKRALDVLSERETQKSNPLDHPEYKSDYDRYLEENGEDGADIS